MSNRSETVAGSPEQPALSIRDVLRQATSETHRRLDAHVAFKPLLDGSISAPAYLRLLELFYGFHRPLEDALCASARDRGDPIMTGRERAHLISADLKQMGRSAADIAALPLCTIQSQLSEVGRFWGCLYVREGATLGGRLLAKRLNHLFGEHMEGRQFLTGRPNDPAEWRLFCAEINTTRQGVNPDAMIAGAQETFQTFEAWLSA